MNLASWFIDGFYIASQTGSSNAGDPTFESPRAIKGCLRKVNRRESTAQGVAVRTVSVFFTDQPIKTGDRLWLPGADQTNPRAGQRLGTVTSQHDKYGATTLYEVDL